ncbi:hypothetical protein [Microbacterium sp. H1-D42]|uniref:hypothetical protein n=1 Tax=Microbacterium sp. H1-D42 TaxID=2925844 RepID=UPI001F531649|nr:hypothetical protein [Microbacterium sp. H1-D42]UNK71143.1 hypothetical protein MNR00_01465 [Microbacterium sp. H1-D42]
MASEPSPLAPARPAAALGGVGWSVLVSLLVLAWLAGFRPVIGWLSTWVVALLFPPAFGLPAMWPILRFTPLGETTVALWLIDLLGVAVMLLTAWIWLRTASRKNRYPSMPRAFGRGLWVTILAVTAGNIVRSVGQSFLLHADLGTYLGQLLAAIVVSLLTGLLLGIIVGLVAMLSAGRRRRADDTAGDTAAGDAAHAAA